MWGNRFIKNYRGEHMIKLKHWQLKGIEFMKDIDKGALFMGTGTGKSITALKIFEDKSSDFKKTLVITTNGSLKKGQWEKEAEMINYNGSITTINFEKLRTQSRVFDILKEDYQFVIVDEAHKVMINHRKRKGGVQAKAVHNITRNAKYVLGLTATYHPNNYVDTYNIMENCDCNPFEIRTETAFIANYYNTYSIPSSWGKPIVKPTALINGVEDEVLSKISSKAYIFFLKKELITIEDFLKDRKLTIDNYSDIMSELLIEDDTSRSIYEERIIGYSNEHDREVLKDVTKGVLEDDTITALKKYSIGQQMANGFMYTEEIVTDEHGDEVFDGKGLVEFTRGTKVYNDDKQNELINIINDYNNGTNKFIVVYKYIYDKETIEALVDEYFPDVDILLLQTSQSEALNLQDYNIMIMYSPSYSYKDREQMMGRIDRIGQENVPHYIMMIREDSIEETIQKGVEKKKKSSDLLKDYNKALKVRTGINARFKEMDDQR